MCRSNGGEIEEGIADLRAALVIAEETGIVDDIGRAYANWIWVLEAAGRLERRPRSPRSASRAPSGWA